MRTSTDRREAVLPPEYPTEIRPTGRPVWRNSWHTSRSVRRRRARSGIGHRSFSRGILGSQRLFPRGAKPTDGRSGSHPPHQERRTSLLGHQRAGRTGTFTVKVRPTYRLAVPGSGRRSAPADSVVATRFGIKGSLMWASGAGWGHPGGSSPGARRACSRFRARRPGPAWRRRSRHRGSRRGRTGAA